VIIFLRLYFAHGEAEDIAQFGDRRYDGQFCRGVPSPRESLVSASKYFPSLSSASRHDFVLDSFIVASRGIRLFLSELGSRAHMVRIASQIANDAGEDFLMLARLLMVLAKSFRGPSTFLMISSAFL